MKSLEHALSSNLLRQHSVVSTSRITNRGSALILSVRGSGKSSNASTASRQYISVSSWLRLAYEDGITDHSIKDIARNFKVHPSTVKRILAVVAFLYLKHQDKMLCALARKAQEPEQVIPLAFGIWSMSWDETKETLLLPLHPELKPAQQRSAWHVLVASHELVLGWGSWESTDPFTVGSLQTTTIPVPLMTTSAACIYDGLFDVAVAKRSVEHAETILRIAKLALFIFNRDGASSNSKLVAHRAAILKNICPDDNYLWCDKVCSLHGNQLTNVAVLHGNMNIVKSIYVVASLCKSGGAFLRLIHAVPATINAMLVCRRGPPPPECIAFTNELKDYCLTHFLARREMNSKKKKKINTHDHDEGWDVNQERSAARVMHSKALDDLFSVLNGEIWDRGGTLVHYCRDDKCCSNFSRQVTMQKIQRGLLDVVLERAPSSPETGKWTKLGPAMDRFFIASCIHGIYRPLFERGLSRLGAKLELPAGEDQDSAANVAYLVDVHWQELVGKQAQAALEFVRDDVKQLHVLVLSLALEPPRLLTYILFLFSRRAKDVCLPPPLTTLCNPVTSPILRLLQYFSSLLSRKGTSRLILLTRMAGCSSIHEFCESRQHLATFFRNMCLVAASWTHRRHWLQLEGWPWRLSVLCDARAPRRVRQRICKQWYDASPCCLDPGFGSRLQDFVLGTYDLVDNRHWLFFLNNWSRSVCVTTAQIEFRHSRHKRMCKSKSLGWSTFAAISCNTEALDIHRVERQTSEELIQSSRQQSLPSGAIGDEDSCASRVGSEQSGKVVWPRGKKALFAFRDMCAARDRARGLKVNACSPAFWQAVQAEWANLEDGSLVRAEAVATSEASRASAAAARVAIRRELKTRCDRSSSSHDLNAIPDAADAGCSSAIVAVSPGIPLSEEVSATVGVPSDRGVFEAARAGAVAHPVRPQWLVGIAAGADDDYRIVPATDAVNGLDQNRPLVPAQVSSEMLREHLVEGSMLATHKRWNSDTVEIGKARPHFPEKVRYFAQCKSLCEQEQAVWIPWRDCICAKLASFTTATTKAAPQAMLRAKVMDATHDVGHVFFAFAVSFLNKAANEEFRLNLCECDVVPPLVKNHTHGCFRVRGVSQKRFFSLCGGAGVVVYMNGGVQGTGTVVFLVISGCMGHADPNPFRGTLNACGFCGCCFGPVRSSAGPTAVSPRFNWVATPTSSKSLTLDAAACGEVLLGTMSPRGASNIQRRSSGRRRWFGA